MRRESVRIQPTSWSSLSMSQPSPLSVERATLQTRSIGALKTRVRSSAWASAEAAISSPAPAAPDVAGGEEDVVERRHPGDQQEGLKDVADAGPAHAGLGAAGQMAHAQVVEPDLAAVGRLEQAQEVEERRLPRPRGAHDGHELSGLGLEIHAGQDPDRAAVRHPIGLLEPDGADQHLVDPRLAALAPAATRPR